MNFSKFMVHEFFGIHSPRFFGIQCPTIFCDFGLFNSLAQAGGGGAYYMIFHYQKHTVLNYFHACACTGGSHVEVGCFASAQVVVPNSQQISCLDGSFLECSLPAREARVRSPAGTCQSRDL